GRLGETEIGQPFYAVVEVHADKGKTRTILQISLHIFARRATNHPLGHLAANEIMEEGKEVHLRAGVCDAANPVVTEVPGAVLEVVRKAVFGKSLVRCR